MADTPESDRKKAQIFFARGKTVGDTGNYDFAITMFLQGLALDPESVEAHKGLREVSLKRKASGGKPLSMLTALGLKRPTKDPKQGMLTAERLLSHDPGNTDHMAALISGAHRGGYFDTALWIGPLLFRANLDQKKPEYSKFIILKDVYKSLNEWELAIEACHQAAKARPDDMELATELKNMAASKTMKDGKYGDARGFRASLRDAEKQSDLMQEDRGVSDQDFVARQIRTAEAEYKADPNEPGKLMKLVEALVKTEQMEHEGRAMDLLDEAYKKSQRYSFRHRQGQIEMKLFARMVRSLEAQLKNDPHDESLQRDLASHRREQVEKELAWFQEWTKNYSSEMSYRYEAARRLFMLKRYNDAIPLLQEATNDPKMRTRASLLLARSFFDANFPDEATEVLGVLINDYPVRGDDDSKEMYYWRARALEQMNQTADALKHFSQLAQWDFNYRDVQAHIKKLRGAASTVSSADVKAKTGIGD